MKTSRKNIVNAFSLAFGIALVGINGHADDKKTGAMPAKQSVNKPSMQDVLKNSKASDWRPLDPQTRFTSRWIKAGCD